MGDIEESQTAAPAKPSTPTAKPKKAKGTGTTTKKKKKQSDTPSKSQQAVNQYPMFAISLLVVVGLLFFVTDGGQSAGKLHGGSKIRLMGAQQTGSVIVAVCGKECSGATVAGLIGSLENSGAKTVKLFLVMHEDDTNMEEVTEAVDTYPAKVVKTSTFLYGGDVALQGPMNNHLAIVPVVKSFLSNLWQEQRGARLRNVYYLMWDVDALFQGDPVQVSSDFHSIMDKADKEREEAETSSLQFIWDLFRKPRSRPDNTIMLQSLDEEVDPDSSEAVHSVMECMRAPKGAKIITRSMVMSLSLIGLLKYVSEVEQSAYKVYECLTCQGDGEESGGAEETEECNEQEQRVGWQAALSASPGARYVIMGEAGGFHLDVDAESGAEITIDADTGLVSTAGRGDPPLIVSSYNMAEEVAQHVASIYQLQPAEGATAEEATAEGATADGASEK